MTGIKDWLTERLLAEEEDRKLHPDDWRYIHECLQCHRRTEHGQHKSEIIKARQYYKLQDGELVVIRSYCEKCSPDSDEEDEAPDVARPAA